MACGCGKTPGTNEINTSTCGGDTPCSNTVVGNCNTLTGCACGCNPCQCNSSQVGAPTPYYNSCTGIQETHCKTVVQSQYVTAVTSSTTFNMPACNFTAVIVIPGLTKIQIGAYLWNSTYGYLEVVSFDFASGQITVKNNCEAGNASPGTNIPACTLFNIVDPPGISGGASQIGVFVASDFVAPAVGDCISIQVTGIAGLTVGSSVQISSGIYRLAAIVSPTIITICNDGAGVVAGTVVVAQDGSGTYITPVTPLNTNACVNTPNTTGAIITCHNGVQAPLDATAIGQVPVVVDAATNEVEFQTLSLPFTVCVTMTSCLNLVAGTDTYTIVVDDSTPLTIGNLIVIQSPGFENIYWTFNSIVGDVQHMSITSTTPITTSEQIGCEGVPVCEAPCCVQLQSDLDECCNGILDGSAICTANWSSAFQTAEASVGVDDSVVVVLTVGQERITPDSKVTIPNNTCNPMAVMFSMNHVVVGHYAAEPGGTGKSIFTPYFGFIEDAVGGALVPTPTALVRLPDYQMWGIGGGSDPCVQYSHEWSKSHSYAFSYALPANRQVTVWVHSKLQFTVMKHYSEGCCHDCAGIDDGTGNLTLDTLRTTINAIGAAVQAA